MRGHGFNLKVSNFFNNIGLNHELYFDADDHLIIFALFKEKNILLDKTSSYEYFIDVNTQEKFLKPKYLKRMKAI